jgi:ectoine hydroxylase-related dioxygenase (phytanoyl-CoA dioxygenase family)
MPCPIPKTLTPRHKFEIKAIPTRSLPLSVLWHTDRPRHVNAYAATIDCVFEMADMVATSNGVSHDVAIDTVLRDEGWTILPTHRRMILQRLQGEPK